MMRRYRITPLKTCIIAAIYLISLTLWLKASYLLWGLSFVCSMKSALRSHLRWHQCGGFSCSNSCAAQGGGGLMIA